MKFVSWNVNGLRAVMNKDFKNIFLRENADFFCLQETKLQAGQIDLSFSGYESYWNYAEKKGYSGTCIFTKHTPINAFCGMGIPEHDTEGRVITLEYPLYYLTCVYVPNAKEDLSRLDYRQVWEDDFLRFQLELEKKKPVIWCGDLNVAHREIDLKNPRSNRGHAGFTDEERSKFQAAVDAGFIDTFRYFYPDKEGAYSWWSYRFHARENNAGWRIDYFMASPALADRLQDARIYAEVTGSDHCPVGLLLKD